MAEQRGLKYPLYVEVSTLKPGHNADTPCIAFVDFIPHNWPKAGKLAPIFIGPGEVFFYTIEQGNVAIILSSCNACYKNKINKSMELFLKE